MKKNTTKTEHTIMMNQTTEAAMQNSMTNRSDAHPSYHQADKPHDDSQTSADHQANASRSITREQAQRLAQAINDTHADEAEISNEVLEFKLRQWGQWARRDNPLNKLGYPTRDVCARFIPDSAPSNRLPDMCEDEAMHIDALIAGMKKRNNNDCRIAKYVYVQRISINDTAKKLGCSRQTVWRAIHRVKKVLGKAL